MGSLRLLALLLALLPGAGGECGPPPPVRGARPADPATSFPEGASVTYECLAGLHKLPGMVQTRLCLRGSTWSPLEPFCDRSCSSPARARFAQLSEEDERKSFYPVGSTVRYICRPGYENVTATQPTSTCLENVTWSDIPELCKRKSCGAPKGPEHGRAAVITDFLFGARMNIICDPGYQLIGRPSISCRLKGNQVAWSDLPTCQIMATQPATPTSDPPGRADVGVNSTAVMATQPATPTSDPPGRADVGVNSTVMTTRPATPTSDPPGRADVGVISTGSCGAPTSLKFAALSKEDEKQNFYPVGIVVRYTCRPGFENITETPPVRTCLENLTWSEVPELCRRKSCGPPRELPNGRAVVKTDYLFGAKVNLLCKDGYELVGQSFINCTLKGDQVEWSKLPVCQLKSAPVGNGSKAKLNSDTFHGSKKHAGTDIKHWYYKKQFHTPWKPSYPAFLGPRSSPRNRVFGSCVSPSPRRFVVPLYTNRIDYPAGSSHTSRCHHSYMGISGMLPSATCFQNTRWSKVPKLCGKRSWSSRGTKAWQSCCYNRFPIPCKSTYYP
ncbi:complement receptor type 1-like isoform X3 [Alligator mississippiensis]|uniref:complement receptor type 1-like isoform X3 n=1 Tax=Alligator mississippiensis TaxID=8496 RepID=UPI002877C3C8|nr:complement receptor type 1-like isoform X3 [Alligator mississippiensis]